MAEPFDPRGYTSAAAVLAVDGILADARRLAARQPAMKAMAPASRRREQPSAAELWQAVLQRGGYLDAR